MTTRQILIVLLLALTAAVGFVVFEWVRAELAHREAYVAIERQNAAYRATLSPPPAAQPAIKGNVVSWAWEMKTPLERAQILEDEACKPVGPRLPVNQRWCDEAIKVKLAAMRAEMRP